MTFLASIVLLVGACRDEPSASARASARTACDRVSRLPGERVRARQLWPGEASVVDVPAPCSGPQCLRALPDRVAVVQPDGRVWLAERGQRDGRVVAAAEAGVPLPASMAARGAGTGPPSLPPELRTCGQSFAGGGVGWHVIRNRGNVWQRVAWVVPPTDAAVAALPSDAYPLATPSGTLCGWGRKRAERRWTIHHAKSGQTQDAVADREHAPARCRGEDGTLVVDVDDGVVVFGPDGQRRHEPAEAPATAGPPGAPGAAVVDLFTSSLVNNPRDVLHVRRADATTLDLPLRDDVDLDQTPLAPGTTRVRLATAGDGAKTLLVAERLALPDCEVRERIFVVDVATGATRRIVDDDVVVLRLSFAAGRFVWAEAEPVLVDTGNEG